MFADPEVEWTAEDLARRTGHPRHTVANELRRLEAADLVTARMIGRSKLLHANADSPYFEPLARLAVMSFGPPLVVREEFGALAPQDVDVLLAGVPDRDAAYDAARRAEQRLGREVNVTIRDAARWHAASDGSPGSCDLRRCLRYP